MALADTQAEVVLAPLPARRRRRRLTIGAILALVWLGLLVLAAVFAPVLPLHDPSSVDALVPSAGPSSHHWLGTDSLGRDELSRVIYGARVSLLISVTATAVAALAGSVVGLLAGYFGRIIDGIAVSLVDVLLAFPPLILAISLTSFLGPSIPNVVAAIAILTFPAFVRISRAQTKSFAERDFVKAAKSIGARRFRIAFREIAPNVVSSVLSYALVIVAVAIVIEASLSFLGLGVSPSTPTWGGMIAAGQPDLENSPHICLIPALALFFTVLSLSALAESSRA